MKLLSIRNNKGEPRIMISASPRLLAWILRAIPNVLWPCKVFLIKGSLKRVGARFRVGPNSQLYDHRLIEIGNNVFLGDGTIIACVVPVRIGDNVMFGPQVMIMAGDHNFSQVGKPMAYVHHGGKNIPIVIENDVWIGSRAIILKGVTVSEGSVVGAGSVVTKSTLPYSVNVGYPSRPKRCRFTNTELEKHLTEVRSKYTMEEIKHQYQRMNVELLA
jgi:acetyltransferase-like isoleucine patch superfamily enzyme